MSHVYQNDTATEQPYTLTLELTPNNHVRIRRSVRIHSKARKSNGYDKTVILPPPGRQAGGGLDRRAKFADVPYEIPDLPEKWPNFTTAARRKIRYSAGALDRETGKEQQVFLTGTLPGSTVDALRTFADQTPRIMKNLQQWLRDSGFTIDLGDGEELYHIGVWELQRRGALHYHALVCVDDSDRLIDQFTAYWYDMLCRISDETGVDLFARSDKAQVRGGPSTWRGHPEKCQMLAQTVTKSITSYLAKYLDKGNSQGQELLEQGIAPPKRWWAMTGACRQLIAKHTQTVNLGTCDEHLWQQIKQAALEAQRLAAWHACLINPYNGLEYCIDTATDTQAEQQDFSDTVLLAVAEHLEDYQSLQHIIESAHWSAIWQQCRHDSQAGWNQWDAQERVVLPGQGIHITRKSFPTPQDPDRYRKAVLWEAA